MKESAQAALTLVKARATELGIDLGLFEKSDVHIHVPAGAIPKDGPSAGVAMFVALVSLLTGRTARSDTAMTGEISLRGLVLPIGGVKEKVLAAARAGITTVLLPARNQKDLEDVPEAARKQVRFVWLEDVDDAVAAALNSAGRARSSGDFRDRAGPFRSPGRAIEVASLVLASSRDLPFRKIPEILTDIRAARPAWVDLFHRTPPSGRDQLFRRPP